MKIGTTVYNLKRITASFMQILSRLSLEHKSDPCLNARQQGLCFLPKTTEVYIHPLNRNLTEMKAVMMTKVMVL